MKVDDPDVSVLRLEDRSAKKALSPAHVLGITNEILAGYGVRSGLRAGHRKDLCIGQLKEGYPRSTSSAEKRGSRNLGESQP